MLNKNAYFYVFECCRLVRGATRSLLIDLQRYQIEAIPNDLYELLITQKGKGLSEILSHYGTDNEATITEYFEFLTQKEYIFWCETAEELAYFPPLSLEWDFPAHITNAIIDVDTTSQHNFAAILPQLEELGCKDIQIRVFCVVPISFFEDILKLLENSRIKSVELFAAYNAAISQEDWRVLCHQYLRIMSVTLHTAPQDANIDIGLSNATSFQLVRQRIDSATHCGVIHPSYFTVNIELFTESQQHNSCLNRKIGIDSNGNIKNCPSLPHSFGNVADTPLAAAIRKQGFQDKWHIRKDEIAVCQDCEFRYICTDCRAYTENPADVYSKPLKCGYNPYEGVWEEWSENPLKQAAIGFYGLQ